MDRDIRFIETQLNILAENLDELAEVVEELAKTHPSKSSAENLYYKVCHVRSYLRNAFDLSDNN